MSAPERIWVWGWYDVDRDSYPVFERDWDEDNPIKHAPWLTSAEMPPAEYIRADAVAEMIQQAVADAEAKALRMAAKALLSNRAALAAMVDAAEEAHATGVSFNVVIGRALRAVGRDEA